MHYVYAIWSQEFLFTHFSLYEKKFREKYIETYLQFNNGFCLSSYIIFSCKAKNTTVKTILMKDSLICFFWPNYSSFITPDFDNFFFIFENKVDILKKEYRFDNCSICKKVNSKNHNWHFGSTCSCDWQVPLKPSVVR